MFARLYDLFMVPNERLGLRKQRAALCREASGRVLEIGIGTGLNIPHYEQAESLVGVDSHRGMLHRAVRRTWESPIPTSLIAADARSLPFPDGAFDTVVVGLSLCTIENPARCLDELARVTVAGGTLHYLEHVRSAQPRTARLQDTFAGVWARVSGGCRANQDTRALLDASPWSIETLWSSRGGGMIQGTARRS
jgi:ubiquinone/menaquinone biosynthesis C-methylase UbiE